MIYSHDDLLARYLEICNRSIAANKDRFPFQQILSAARDAQNQKTVEVCIVDDHPEAEYVIHLDEHKVLRSEKHKDCADCSCDNQWRVTRSYLEEVISNAQDYIENPAKIDWDWMVTSPEDSQKS